MILVQKITNGTMYKRNVHLHFQTIAHISFKMFGKAIGLFSYSKENELGI